VADKYIDVITGTFYLKKIFLSMGVGVDNLDITAEEIAYCETWAENQIDGLFGLSFPLFPATPLIIRDIALALTAYKIRQFLVTANSPNLDEHTNEIRDEAYRLIQSIIHGDFSIIMPDLSYHPKYPGPSGGERFMVQPESSLRLFFTNMDKEFYAMHQKAEPDGIEPAFSDPEYANQS